MKTRAFVFALLLTAAVLFAPVFPKSEVSAGSVSADAEFDKFCFDDIDALYIPASAAVLMEAESGMVYFSKAPRKRLPNASTTKIMTSLLACELLAPDTVITVTEDTAGIEGSSVYLQAGEKLTCEELVYCAMLRSGNDAAYTLAKACGGSIDNFVALMNLRARSMGLRDTHFANPAGLPDENHYSSAYDLAVMTCEALKNEAFAKIAATERISVCGGKRYLVNRNRLMSLYGGMIGVKTGYTPQAGRCLVTAATRNGVTLVAVTLNDNDQWSDHRRMLDHGFGTLERVTVAEKGALCTELKIAGGESESVKVSNPEAIALVLPRGAKLFCEPERRFLAYAPVKRGENMCRAVVYADGNPVLSIPLCAENGVETAKISLFQKLTGKRWDK